MRPSAQFDRCPHVLSTGHRCIMRRNVEHAEHVDACTPGRAGYEGNTDEHLALDFEIWLAECDYAVRMSGIDPDDPCPAIVPFEPKGMVRA